MPRFTGRSHNPNDYLTKLKKYVEKQIMKQPTQEPLEILMDILEVSLEGHAARWFQLIKKDLTSWEQFQTEFTAKYWSREVQKSIVARIETETYRNNGNLTRAEYFVERAISLQSIAPPLDEQEIVLILSERFEQLIQDSRSVQNISTIRDFERLLHKEDLKDAHLRSKRKHDSLEKQSHSRPSSPKHDQGNHNQKAYPQRQQQWNNRRDPQRPPGNQNGNWKHQQSSPNYRPWQNPGYHPYNHYQGNKPPNNGNQNETAKQYPTDEQMKVCSFIRQSEQSERKPITTSHPQDASSEPNASVSNQTMQEN